MIGTRLWVGSLLAIAAAGVLFGDSWLAQCGFAWFPFLFVFLVFAGIVGTRELVRLLPAAHRPSRALVTCGVLLALAANWFPVARLQFSPAPASPWPMLVFVFVGFLIAAFLLELARYTGDASVAVPRMAFAMFAVAYLGVLPAFFAQIRWLAPADLSGLMLALVVFVPKCNDIGAFFTGTFFGRHKMTPLLSPKKTWEGFAGGMVAGAGAAVVLSFLGPVFRYGPLEAAAFGLVAGAAGVLGDLAESLVKRGGQSKDASTALPGFGGILDVVDSVLFAAPVAYLWFSFH